MPVIAVPTTTAYAPKSKARRANSGEEIPPSQIAGTFNFLPSGKGVQNREA